MLTEHQIATCQSNTDRLITGKVILIFFSFRKRERLNQKPNSLLLYFSFFSLTPNGSKPEPLPSTGYVRGFNFWIGPDESSLLCVLDLFALKSFSLVGFAMSLFSFFSLLFLFCIFGCGWCLGEWFLRVVYLSSINVFFCFQINQVVFTTGRMLPGRYED